MTDTRAEVRRRALRQVMAEKGLTPADVARLAGLPNANSIYNLLGRRSSSLSASTYERIAQALGPTVTVADLAGLQEKAPGPSKGLTLRMVAQAGVWRERAELPLSEQAEVQLPATRDQLLAGAYAVDVRTPGAELRWPQGATLLCVPPDLSDKPMQAGSWVVLERMAEGKVEVTARQIEVENGRAWLWLRTRDPRQVGAVPVQWPCDGRPWKANGERFMIASSVVGAYEPLR